MKKFDFTIKGNKYEVEISSFENNIAEIEVNGTHYSVEVHQEVKKSKTPTLVRPEVVNKRTESKIKKSVGGVSFAVKAPLPGTILSVSVNVGDSVKRGQELMIMEAMKMENKVLAEKDGTIKSIKVNTGDAVLQNDVLIEME
ncbi:MAG: biotin/lipoyl-binding protein [Bacteroidales bacterium]|jgi:biotin carboxyl carrier protein|nr:biotin/lipoyl-binding protein [Bacteroidales bacterium]